MVRIRFNSKGEKIAEWKDDKLAWASPEFYEPKSTHYIMPDIKPYQSMIDGSLISSRSQHKAHLRQHGCIEIGNEVTHLKPYKQDSPPGLKETLLRVANEKLRSK